MRHLRFGLLVLIVILAASAALAASYSNARAESAYWTMTCPLIMSMSHA